MFARNITVVPGCLSPRYQFQSSQRLNFLDLRPNKKLCLGFSVTTYSMNACDEYLHPCNLIRGSTMLCLPVMTSSPRYREWAKGEPDLALSHQQSASTSK